MNSLSQFEKLTQLTNRLLRDKAFFSSLDSAVSIITDVLKSKHQIFSCGNGGSMTTATHLAEELVGRYRANRQPLPCRALGSEPSALTCIANDFSFDEIFARELEAYAKENDCLIAFSTSGDSPNIQKALKRAKELGVKTIGILGKTGGKAATMCDCAVVVPDSDTARIQEIHTFILHAICEAAETILKNE